jgi:hypothetical protein
MARRVSNDRRFSPPIGNVGDPNAVTTATDLEAMTDNDYFGFNLDSTRHYLRSRQGCSLRPHACWPRWPIADAIVHGSRRLRRRAAAISTIPAAAANTFDAGSSWPLNSRGASRVFQ